MNVSTTLIQFASNMVSQLPLLLAYIAGIVLCAVRWRRSPRAALLAVIGISVTLLATVGFSVLNAYLINNQMAARAPMTQIGTTLVVLGIANASIRAAGFILIAIAVFVGREQEIGRGFDISPNPPPLPKRIGP